jgi:glutamate-1-semialdehyde 2,1-aminomutase
MYAMLLARAYTGRDMVMKVGGGWHGANLWGLKGVGHKDGFKKVDSVGIPENLADDVIVTTYNDPQKLEDAFKVNGACLACFIVEPVIGAGGMLPASKEYLETARRLCDQYGVVLIFDEIVSGFRYRAGDVGRLYGIRPDLLTLGKVMGGGMPVAAVGGRAEIMTLVGREKGQKVKFSGGTYSAHPASMLAAKTMVSYLVNHEDEVYPHLGALGAYTRQQVMAVFEDAGVLACFTGVENILPNHSMNMLVFPYEEDCGPLNRPDQVVNPEVVDLTLEKVVLKLAMLLENVHTIYGLGVLTTAHTMADIDTLAEAYRRALVRVKPFLG